MTSGASTASSIDEQDVIRRLEAALSDVVSRAAEIIDVLDRLEAKLDEQRKNVPESAERAAFEHRDAMLKWRPDPPTMPRQITAFIVLERFRAARATCAY